jgi:hypothetical protein
MLRARLNPELARYMTEDELLQALTDAGSYLGWRWHHIRRSDQALQQGHSGFPDLVLARAGRVMFLELKSQYGELRHDQRQWLEELSGGPPRLYVDVVRPRDLDRVLGMLGARFTKDLEP